MRIVPLLASLAFGLGLAVSRFSSVTAEGNAPFQLNEEFPARSLLFIGNRTTATTTDPARASGALALYSLFGLFVFSSVAICTISIVVSLQWPNPRVCCYRTPHSDAASSGSCGCCPLHRLNIGYCVTWLALLVLLALALIVYLMVAAGLLAALHAALAFRLVRHIRRSYRELAALQMAGGGAGAGAGAGAVQHTAPAVTGIPVPAPLPGVPLPGIPVLDVPMRVAFIQAQLPAHAKYGGWGGRVAPEGSGAAVAGIARGEAAAAADAGAGAGIGAAGSQKAAAWAHAGGAARPGSPRADPGRMPSGGGSGGDRSGSSSSSSSTNTYGREAIPVAAVLDRRVECQQALPDGCPGQAERGRQAGHPPPGAVAEPSPSAGGRRGAPRARGSPPQGELGPAGAGHAGFTDAPTRAAEEAALGATQAPDAALARAAQAPAAASIEGP